MSWAVKRRILYIVGLIAFFALLIGGPVMIFSHRPESCRDGIQNQGETSVDRGGPCILLDESSLSPHAVLWTRAFKVRPGSYDVTTYIENPNEKAGVAAARYRFSMYDSENVIVAEREGTTFIMPGGITPVFLGGIDAGTRTVTRSYFQFTRLPLTWERMTNVAHAISIGNRIVSDLGTMPRVNATVRNNGVKDLTDILFVVVMFDPAGNAFASSQTALTRLDAGEERQIVFTWPQAFGIVLGRVDIIPVHEPLRMVEGDLK